MGLNCPVPFLLFVFFDELNKEIQKKMERYATDSDLFVLAEAQHIDDVVFIEASLI